MGGDDSQKLLPWRGTYSSPGRSKPPAHSKINTLTQMPEPPGSVGGGDWRCATTGPVPVSGIGSATHRLGQSRKAEAGNFSRVPKTPSIALFFAGEAAQSLAMRVLKESFRQWLSLPADF